MPLHVAIYTIEGGKNSKAGTITLSETGLSTRPTPGNENLLKRIVREPIQDPKTKQTVTSMSNPEEWMRALAFHYKSAYLRASHASLTEPDIISPGSQQPTQPSPTTGGNAPQSPQTPPAGNPGQPPPTAQKTPQTTPQGQP